jgi:hypothetical protein
LRAEPIDQHRAAIARFRIDDLDHFETGFA